MEREGFTSISELRRFLDGLEDGEYSKVYLQVNQRDGHNYLDVYLDNNFGEGHPWSGFKHFYQLKMNEVSIPADNIKKAEEVLADNGIEEDETSEVLQAIGYTLLDAELYPDE